MSAVQVEIQKVKKVSGWILNPEQWVKNETTKRMIKIGSENHKKMLGETVEKTKKIPGWKVNPEQWVKSETTKRMVKIGSESHKKMIGETVEKKVVDRTGTILNPTGTGRYIKIDGKLFKKLKTDGLIKPEMILPLSEMSGEEQADLLQ